jgi:fumarate reductase subunit C
VDEVGAPGRVAQPYGGGAQMSGRSAGWLAWGIWALIMPAVALTLFLTSLNELSSSFRNTTFLSLLILAFSTVGALVASRRPENPIGWLFCSGALVWILGELTLEYSVHVLITNPGAFPAGAWAAWFGGWARGLGWFLIVVFLLLLFPTGRLPSPRWRPVLWGAVGYIGYFTLVVWFSPVSADTRLEFVRNPLGLEIEIMNLLVELLYLTIPLLLVVSGTAVIVRFRRSRGEERQQLKWFAYAVAVMVVLFAFWFSLELAGLVPLSGLAFTVPLLGLPIATGIAILKYRLYDIDVIVNRTLVYGTLTATLAATYFGGVVLLQGAFRALTGQESQLAIVASTLLIAALFVPLRRRVQTFIDRRFYRRKYDAARTLQDFSARLRDEVELDRLTDDLVTVVRETLQPQHASLWLRPPVGRDREKAAERDR